MKFASPWSSCYNLAELNRVKAQRIQRGMEMKMGKMNAVIASLFISLAASANGVERVKMSIDELPITKKGYRMSMEVLNKYCGEGIADVIAHEFLSLRDPRVQ